MSFSQLRRALGAVVATTLALVVTAAPAPAEANALAGLLLDPPGAGYELVGADFSYSGPVGPDREPLTEASPANSGFAGGWRKVFGNPSTGSILIVEVAELESSRLVDTALEEAKEDNIVRGAVPFAVPGVPGAVGASFDHPRTDGSPARQHTVLFPYGRHVFRVDATSLTDPTSNDPHAAVLAAATHYDHLAAALGEPVSDPADIYAQSYTVGRTVGMVVIPLLFIAIVLTFVRKGRREKTAGPPPVAGLHDDEYSLAAAPAAPTRPAFDPMGPASFADPGGAPAATTTAAPATFAAPPPDLESRPCPACGDDFGLGHECESCGAPRRNCLVCGTKIWAGATTCSDHSGVHAWS